MSHLASTMRKIEDDEFKDIAEERERQEAAGIDDLLPGVGTTVQFTLRGEEYRNGTNRFAALVTRPNPETGLVSLVVVLGADDFMDQRDVPRKTPENGWGWEPAEDATAELRAEVDELRTSLEAFKEELAAVLFGDHEKGPESVYDVLLEHDQRIEAMEPGVTPAAKPAKRKYPRRAKG